MDRNQILFARLKPKAIIPSKRDEDAGYDVYACFDEDFIAIPPNTTVMIPTGIASALHPSKYIQFEERGSTGSKGMKCSCGIIDSGYRGEWFVALTNCNNIDIIISNLSKEDLEKKSFRDQYGDTYVLDSNNKKQYIYYKDLDCTDQPCYIYYPATKAIAQAIVHEVHRMNITEVSYEELTSIKSERGTGIIGSTNK